LAICNGLLAALPSNDLAALLLHLGAVDVLNGNIIYSSDSVIEAVYFPVSGMISLFTNLADGAQAEVGIIGHEGMLGMSLLSGDDKSYVEAIVEMPGTLLRMTAIRFRREIAINGSLRELLTRYMEVKRAQVMQTAACNGHHALVQRLAFFLLMAHDRVDGDKLHFTQEVMATMLGVLRPAISIAAAELQRTKLIRYASGRITGLDRAGLEKASCECYAAVQARMIALLGATEVRFHKDEVTAPIGPA
jgi:CRP-like cAMP-binding protein